MSSRLTRRFISQEVLHFQENRNLYLTLVGIFKEVKEANDTSKEALKSLSESIQSAIKQHTNLTFIVVLDNSRFAQPNAYAIVPPIHLSSSVMDRAKEHYKAFPELEAEYKKVVETLKLADKSLEGSIDLRDGKVSGIFSKFPFQMVVTTCLFLGDGKHGLIPGFKSHLLLTPEEIAAVLLHEIGHIFTYLELLYMTTSTNMALDDVVKELKGEKDESVRIKLIEKTKAKLKIKNLDSASLAKQKKNTVIQSVILDAAVEDTTSLTGSVVYEFRNSEFLADQYAVRQGAGRALASGLEKIEVWSNYSVAKMREWRLRHYVFSILGTFLDVFGTPTYLMLLALPGLDMVLYDAPKDRLVRIKQQMVNSLKDETLSPETRDDTLEDIRTVQESIDRLRDGDAGAPVFMALYRRMTSWRREQESQLQFQKRLEALASNDLFVAGQQLASLAQQR
ncbi:MAG TPA: hypothetical protein VN081_00510 [Dongiaceae bacterium]|nr:hypothetical protein [Dongiaceae bacterium]